MTPSQDPEFVPPHGPLEMGDPRASRSAKRGPRTHPFVLRMSDDERDEIQQQADRLHFSSAAYIRARIFRYRLPSPRGIIDDEVYRILSKLSIDVRNAGANVNQLAHAHHLGFTVGSEEVRLALQQLRHEVDKVRLHLVQIAQDFEMPDTPQDSWMEDES